jgi:CheY-like chemotaxis protein
MRIYYPIDLGWLRGTAINFLTMNTQFNSIRTLIVDDSTDECVLLSAELRAIHSIRLIGFVGDGVEAISYLQGVEQFNNRELFPYPDLVLLDFCMPRCGGMGVLKFLQQQFHRPRVVLWSNTMERVSVPLALRLGADLVCQKPARKEELVEIMHRIETKIFRRSPVVVPSTRTTTTLMPVDISGGQIASAKRIH